MAVYNYPAPRAPEHKEPTSIEECLPAARGLVQKLAEDEKRPEVGVAPRLYTREGSKFLIVTTPDQNKYVTEAVTQALMEQGAEKVDFIYPHDLGLPDPEAKVRVSLEYGWGEMKRMGQDVTRTTEEMAEAGPNLAEATAKYLDEHLEYSFVVLAGGGHLVSRQLGRHAHKFNSFWPFGNWMRFLTESHTLPGELWLELERRIVRPLGEASQVRVTDPEGTYLEFSVTAEEAKMWANDAFLHGHLFMEPLMASGDVVGSARRRRQEGYIRPLTFPRTNGVLAGTANHHGYVPRIETYYKDSRLVDVKGGGRYGDDIKEMMDKYKDIHMPGYPDKGLFWFCDIALCTAIGTHREESAGACGGETRRAGIFHLGFGTRLPRIEPEKFGEYAEKHSVPRGHIHEHLYFATYEIKMRGTDYWYKIVDKGWITALDDPVIRTMAAKYGDPDEILKYDWIPPVPGINCEGDYLKDYAPDPLAYLKKRMKEGKTI